MNVRSVLVASLLLSACQGMPITEFALADVRNAQKIAATPERAAVWKAVEAQIVALETANAAIAAQIKACEESLKLQGPKGTVGVATLIEFGAGAANTVSANCKPIPLPHLPKL